jgi:hypothetical protein
VPPLPSWLTNPLWDQFCALLPDRGPYHPDHPLGCHRPPVPDRVIFDKLIQVLVFGCGYRKIADATCSATTIRDRRDQWIGLGVFATLELLVLQAYDRMVGLALSDLAVDGCITKAPCGGDASGRSPVDRGKQGRKRSTVTEARGIPLGAVAAGANRHDAPLLGPTLDTLGGSARCRLSQWCTWTPATTASRPATCSMSVARTARSPPRARPPQSRPPAAGRWSGPMPGATSSRSWSGTPNATTEPVNLSETHQPGNC